jgi:hypothetical protein
MGTVYLVQIRSVKNVSQKQLNVSIVTQRHISLVKHAKILVVMGITLMLQNVPNVMKAVRLVLNQINVLPVNPDTSFPMASVN